MRGLIFGLLACIYFPLHGQQLKPGFDPKEYHDVLSLSERGDSIKDPDNFKLLYISPEVGFYNRWFLWKRSDGVVVIKIRGTIEKTESWLANFYAAMIPAKGSLQLTDSTRFDYKLAPDSAAAYVHVGWTVSLGFMAPDIVAHIKAQYKEGAREFIIMGHSQGGAIAFLTRSYLEYLPDMPKDIKYKTYCSAGPKPGNLFYAYDFDYITRDGWGFRIVNSADWVPETPLSLQRVTDFNPVNPFMEIPGTLKKQKFFVRLYGNMVYNKLTRATNRSVRRYRKYLGGFVYKMSRKKLPGFQQPAYVYSNNYMTAGSPIVLMADEEYYRQFPFDGKNVFINHMPPQYLYLLKKQYRF
ncbi:lipase family protein [Chitinophaga sp. SYP-B3965]|uniref:lipase family protein n=1 Tax=Chitinophaga sp. SYP-B3965 TaxID=2663120 RepID=UPI001299A842|nr:lipase family protein [Chitinophaga sp. SYP-B3965]MRG46473.1 lipase family protein [Chitinophaga sp. SYP-B3965]